jgi:osmotically-inducible protein OsmY
MADDRWRDEDWRRGEDDRNRFGRQRYGQGGSYGQGEQRPYHEHPESQSQWDERPGYAQDQRRRYGEGGSRYGGESWRGGESDRWRGGYGSETWRGGYGEGGIGGGGWTGGGYGGGYLGGRGTTRSGYGSEGQDWSGAGYGGEGIGSRYGGYGRGYGSAGYGGSYGRGTDWSGSSYGEGWAGGRREAGYGRDREQDRGWFDRAADEVSSWFGDEEAERRRRRDQERGHYGKGPRGYARSDERIREDVNDRLTDDWQVDASEIEVNVSNGEVTLSGTVNTRDEKRRAEDLAENVSGVRHVQNNLRVQSQGTGLASTEASTTTGAKIRQSGSTATDQTGKRT